MLIVGRAFAGMGGSGIMNGAFTIIAGCVPMAKRPGMFPRKEKLVRRLTMLVALIGFVTACMFQLHLFPTDNMFTRLYSFTTRPDNRTIDRWITDGIHDLEMV
jgi:MFS family permease